MKFRKECAFFGCRLKVQPTPRRTTIVKLRDDDIPNPEMRYLRYLGVRADGTVFYLNLPLAISERDPKWVEMDIFDVDDVDAVIQLVKEILAPILEGQ